MNVSRDSPTFLGQFLVGLVVALPVTAHRAAAVLHAVGVLNNEQLAVGCSVKIRINTILHLTASRTERCARVVKMTALPVGQQLVVVVHAQGVLAPLTPVNPLINVCCNRSHNISLLLAVLVLVAHGALVAAVLGLAVALAVDALQHRVAAVAVAAAAAHSVVRTAVPVTSFVALLRRRRCKTK